MSLLSRIARRLAQTEPVFPVGTRVRSKAVFSGDSPDNEIGVVTSVIQPDEDMGDEGPIEAMYMVDWGFYPALDQQTGRPHSHAGQVCEDCYTADELERADVKQWKWKGGKREAANTYYKLPADREMRFYDFYAAEQLAGLLQQNATMGKTNPAGTFKTYDEGDSDLVSAQEAIQTITSSLRDELLRNIFQACAGELRHFSGKVETPGLQAYFHDLAARGRSQQTGLKPGKERMQQYPEFPATSTSRAEGLSSAIKVTRESGRARFMAEAVQIFATHGWSSSYGGKPWSDIAAAWGMLNEAKTTQELFIAIDHVLDLEHNNNTFFDKIPTYQKDGGFGWVREMLDDKYEAALPDILKKSSSDMRRIVQRVARRLNPALLRDPRKDRQPETDTTSDLNVLQSGHQLAVGDWVKVLPVYNSPETMVGKVFKVKNVNPTGSVDVDLAGQPLLGHAKIAFLTANQIQYIAPANYAAFGINGFKAYQLAVGDRVKILMGAHTGKLGEIKGLPSTDPQLYSVLLDGFGTLAYGASSLQLVDASFKGTLGQPQSAGVSWDPEVGPITMLNRQDPLYELKLAVLNHPRYGILLDSGALREELAEPKTSAYDHAAIEKAIEEVDQAAKSLADATTEEDVVKVLLGQDPGFTIEGVVAELAKLKKQLQSKPPFVVGDTIQYVYSEPFWTGVVKEVKQDTDDEWYVKLIPNGLVADPEMAVTWYAASDFKKVAYPAGPKQSPASMSGPTFKPGDKVIGPDTSAVGTVINYSSSKDAFYVEFPDGDEYVKAADLEHAGPKPDLSGLSGQFTIQHTNTQFKKGDKVLVNMTGVGQDEAGTVLSDLLVTGVYYVQIPGAKIYAKPLALKLAPPASFKVGDLVKVKQPGANDPKGYGTVQDVNQKGACWVAGWSDYLTSFPDEVAGWYAASDLELVGKHQAAKTTLNHMTTFTHTPRTGQVTVKKQKAGEQAVVDGSQVPAAEYKMRFFTEADQTGSSRNPVYWAVEIAKAIRDYPAGDPQAAYDNILKKAKMTGLTKGEEQAVTALLLRWSVPIKLTDPKLEGQGTAGLDTNQQEFVQRQVQASTAFPTASIAARLANRRQAVESATNFLQDAAYYAANRERLLQARKVQKRLASSSVQEAALESHIMRQLAAGFTRPEIATELPTSGFPEELARHAILKLVPPKVELSGPRLKLANSRAETRQQRRDAALVKIAQAADQSTLTEPQKLRLAALKSQYALAGAFWIRTAQWAGPKDRPDPAVSCERLEAEGYTKQSGDDVSSTYLSSDGSHTIKVSPSTIAVQGVVDPKQSYAFGPAHLGTFLSRLPSFGGGKAAPKKHVLLDSGKTLDELPENAPQEKVRPVIVRLLQEGKTDAEIMAELRERFPHRKPVNMRGQLWLERNKDRYPKKPKREAAGFAGRGDGTGTYVSSGVETLESATEMDLSPVLEAARAAFAEEAPEQSFEAWLAHSPTGQPFLQQIGQEAQKADAERQGMALVLARLSDGRVLQATISPTGQADVKLLGRRALRSAAVGTDSAEEAWCRYAQYYDDNFGAWDMGDGPDREDTEAFYHQTQKRSVEKTCQGCGRKVRILPGYAYCNGCTEIAERGGEFPDHHGDEPEERDAKRSAANRVVRPWSREEPGEIACDCGCKLSLDSPGQDTETCCCGATYNSSGQLLADRSQWGEETGETAADFDEGVGNPTRAFDDR